MEKYTLSNGTCSTEIITYGATLISFRAPDKHGIVEECTINFKTLDEIAKGPSYYGATCGRVANRIAKGTFNLDDKMYSLATNNGPNALHGGLKGFDKVVWQAQEVATADSVGVRLMYVSRDGEEGYPGEVRVEVTISLDASNALKFEYMCTTDAPTPLNITNHTYWNLSGSARRSILSHEARVHARQYTPADGTAIPFGHYAPVAGTALDLTSMTSLASRVPDADGFGMPGIDHNYVLDAHHDARDGGGTGTLAPAAELHDPQSGRRMVVQTTEPGVQCYTMNWASTDPKDAPHVQHNAICFEAQHFPDSINKPAFPSTVLRPGEVYRQTTVHTFEAA